MNLGFSLSNLWLYYVFVYAVGLAMQTWANNKRGKPFDDPEFLFSRKYIVAVAMIWIISGFIISLFVPVSFGVSFYLGLFFFLCGLTILGFAAYSFAYQSGLAVTGIHRYSRNPLYVGWTFVIFSLCLIGWSASIWSVLFLIYFLITIPYFHWTVLLEEKFLANKYGDAYREYLRNTPRYFGLP